MESDPGLRARHIDAMVAQLPDLDDSARREMAAAVADTSDILRGRGIVLAAQLTLLDEEPTITATMTATLAQLPDGGMPQLDPSSTRDAVQALSEILGTHNPGATVDVVDLPNGPLVRTEQATLVTVSAEVAGTESPIRVPAREVQYLMPTADGDSLIVIGVNSPHLDHWASFKRLAEQIAGTISHESSAVLGG